MAPWSGVGTADWGLAEVRGEQGGVERGREADFGEDGDEAEADRDGEFGLATGTGLEEGRGEGVDLFPFAFLAFGPAEVLAATERGGVVETFLEAAEEPEGGAAKENKGCESLT